MTKEEFEKQYGAQLNLIEKKWFLMSPKANKDNNLVLISGYREIDFDYLYFVYKDEVWEMLLDGNVRSYGGELFTTRELFQFVLDSKKSLNYYPPGNDILYRGSGVKGQIIVALNYFATKIKSVLDPVSTIQVPKEVLETKSVIDGTVFTGIHVNKKVDIFEKLEENAHKEAAAEVFGAKHVLEELRDYLKSIGYHTSIVDYVTKNTDVLFIKEKGKWDMNYLDALIENAKFAEENMVITSQPFDKALKVGNSSTDIFYDSKDAWKELAELNSKEFVEEVKNSALKNDNGKVSYSDLPPYALEQVAKAFNHGSDKYGKYNYRSGMEYLRYYDACFRHMQAWIKGEDIDESGNTHLSHAVASLLMLMENINLSTGVDNRPK